MDTRIGVLVLFSVGSPLAVTSSCGSLSRSRTDETVNRQRENRQTSCCRPPRRGTVMALLACWVPLLATTLLSSATRLRGGAHGAEEALFDRLCSEYNVHAVTPRLELKTAPRTLIPCIPPHCPSSRPTSLSPGPGSELDPAVAACAPAHTSGWGARALLHGCCRKRRAGASGAVGALPRCGAAARRCGRSQTRAPSLPIWSEVLT